MIDKLDNTARLHDLTKEWFLESCKVKYSYRFTWMGRPIIQYPQDIMAMQELIWRIQPDLIIETGIAHGGSLVFYASMLELLGGDRRVVGIDIDIRAHNRAALDAHPMRRRIDLIEGSSIAPAIVAQVEQAAAGRKTVIVVLDSNHTHDHVLAELRAYSSLVTKDSYLIVFDTVVEDMPDEMFPDRPWRKGNSPKSAVRAFLAEEPRFQIDKDIEDRVLITVSPDGFLRRVS
jgi:cephalosporin hydroxylase